MFNETCTTTNYRQNEGYLAMTYSRPPVIVLIQSQVIKYTLSWEIVWCNNPKLQYLTTWEGLTHVKKKKAKKNMIQGLEDACGPIDPHFNVTPLMWCEVLRDHVLFHHFNKL